VWVLKTYIEERVVEVANYIIDKNTTVRDAAKRFGISKSTVHTDLMKPNGFIGKQRGSKAFDYCWSDLEQK